MNRKGPMPAIRYADTITTGTVICNLCKQMISEVRIGELSYTLKHTIEEHKRHCHSEYGFNILIDNLV